MLLQFFDGSTTYSIPVAHIQCMSVSPCAEGGTVQMYAANRWWTWHFHTFEKAKQKYKELQDIVDTDRTIQLSSSESSPS